jgi:hypothetical protein
MLAAALIYASLGIPVLPLHTPTPGGCSCRRPGCDRPGKHPRLRHGLTDASSDLRQVDLWWQRWPEANIGLRTGIVMDVVDVDSDEGRHALAHLTGDCATAGPVARTGSGGWHLWVRPTGEGNRVRLLPGVDWRGAGGYVVAPPSRHASGATYRWLRRPEAVELPPCPPALRELLAGPPAPRWPAAGIHHPDRYAEAALAAETERVAAAVVGTRNDTLNRAAFALGQLVGAGLLDAATVRRELTAAARHAGLGRGETARTIRSGLTAGVRRPRAESRRLRAPSRHAA